MRQGKITGYSTAADDKRIFTIILTNVNNINTINVPQSYTLDTCYFVVSNSVPSNFTASLNIHDLSSTMILFNDEIANGIATEGCITLFHATDNSQQQYPVRFTLTANASATVIITAICVKRYYGNANSPNGGPNSVRNAITAKTIYTNEFKPINTSLPITANANITINGILQANGTTYLEIGLARNGFTTYATILTANNVGIAGGVCELDNNGLVPINRLPGGLLTYISTWDPATNTPTLTNPDITKKGYVYYVNNAGTRFSINWEDGDWLVYNYNGDVERRANNYNTDTKSAFFQGDGNFIPIGTIAKTFIGYSANIFRVKVVSVGGTATAEFDVVKNGTSMIGSGTRPYLSAEIERDIDTSDWSTKSITFGDNVDIVLINNTNLTDGYVVLYVLITE